MLGDRGRRGVVLSTTSTVVVLAVLVGIFLLAPGSAQVRHTFFNPADMWQSFVGDPKAGYYSVGEALWLNIRMFVAAEILILIVALAVAVGRQVTRPRPMRNTTPPLLNDFISLQKDTAQVGLLGAIEANKAAEIYSSTVFNYSSYVVAAILFLALTIPLARFTDHLIRRDQARRLAGAGQLWAARERFPFPVRGIGKRCGSRGCASRSARTRCSAGWTWMWLRTRSSA